MGKEEVKGKGRWNDTSLGKFWYVLMIVITQANEIITQSDTMTSGPSDDVS